MTIKISTVKVLSLFIIGICSLSCKKALEVDLPIDRTSSEVVFQKLPTAVAAVRGLYSKLAVGSLIGGYRGNFSVKAGLMADELTGDGAYSDYFQNSQTSLEFGPWSTTYQENIFMSNSVIEGATASKTLTSEEKKIIISEAKFVRAICYFNLVNLYGDLPLVLTTDYKINSNISRTSKKEIYRQIVQDLLSAKDGLSENYLSDDLVSITNERTCPNKYAASAMLARIYLFTENWIEAERESSYVISSNSIYQMEPLSKVFLKESKEAIWQLQTDRNYNDGLQRNPGVADEYIPLRDEATNVYNVPDIWISKFLLNEFELGDRRRIEWVKDIQVNASTPVAIYSIPFKYRNGNNTGSPGLQLEYIMVLRLAEQFLIRAEAKAHLGNLDEAKEDINKVRLRSFLPPTEASTFDEILHAIDHERYVELFTEGNHRWFDLKRRNNINERMKIVTPTKTISWIAGVPQWSPDMALLGIPYEEFLRNPALKGHQNPGYNETP